MIGFAGAPFTLASYLVEGGPSRDYAKTKTMMLADPVLWHELCTRLADISAASSRCRSGAGAAAVQLFDSWAGSLRRLTTPASRSPIRPASPATVAGRRAPHSLRGRYGELLGLMADAGADVVGVDWRLPLAEASRRSGPSHAVQGNLDPALLEFPGRCSRSGCAR